MPVPRQTDAVLPRIPQSCSQLRQPRCLWVAVGRLGHQPVRSPAFFPPARGWAPLMPGVTIERAWAGPLSGQALPPLAFTQPESDPGRSPAVAALPEPGFEMCFPGTRFAAETEVSNRKGGEDFSACFSRANGPFKPVITAMHLTAGEPGGSRSCSHFPGTPAYRPGSRGHQLLQHWPSGERDDPAQDRLGICL